MRNARISNLVEQIWYNKRLYPIRRVLLWKLFMKCGLCEQRKAKRLCPAKNTSICAQCCGEKRILEIDCPESCEYLNTGRTHEVKDYLRYLRIAPLPKQEKNRRILDSYRDVVAHLESALAEERLRAKRLADKDVAEALDLLLETYRTEDRGVLYEKSSSNLNIDMLRKGLRDIIEHYRNPGTDREGKVLIAGEDKRLPLKSAIECLEFIRDMAASHIEEQVSPTSYVDLLARIIPRKRNQNAPQSSILIP